MSCDRSTIFMDFLSGYSVHDHAGGDVEILTSDRGRGGEVDAGRGYVLGRHHLAQRGSAAYLGPDLLLGNTADLGLLAYHHVHPRPGHVAGADRVDPDAVRPEFR